MMKILRLIVLSLMSLVVFTSNGNAQTVLVDPAGAGGFENGTTFAANGWTVGNSANNPWIVAPLSNGLITGNAAFISDNGTTPTYTPANNSSNYFWRDVTIPAGEGNIKLTFNWICNGESTWDMWQVFVAPTTVVPSGTTTYPGNGATAVPAGIAGATWVGNGNLQTTVQTATLYLPSSVAGTTVRLIFHWKNDGGGTQPPAQIDNISLTSQVPGTFISIATGDWNNPSTWDANAVPTPADNAVVSIGHTVSANAIGQGIGNLTVNGTLAYTTTPAQFNVNGNLTVNATGLVNAFFTTTGKTLVVSGNIVNDGRIDISVGTTTAGNLTLNGSTVQTVSGLGAFGGTNATTTNLNTVGVIRNLTFSNTNTSTPNIIWSIPSTIRIANNLNLTGARVNASGSTFNFGNFAAGVTLTSPVGTGFMSGTKFARWWTTNGTGTAINAGAEPTTVTSMYPFVSNAGQNRRAHIERSSSLATGNTVGYLAVLFQNSTVLTQALSIDDAGYTVTDRFEANWTVTAESGYVYGSGTHEISLVGTGGFFPINGNSRVLLQNSSVGGAHQNGTTLPVAQRSGLSTAQLTTGALYMGVNTLDNVYPCTGTPTGGTTVSSATPACSGVNFTLSLTGNTSGPGITYQWQSSSDGDQWTNITGATLATRAVSQTVATYYQCIVTCDGNSTPSTPIMINLDIPTNCYCIPTTTFGCTDGDVIARVVLNTLDNNSGTGCPSGTLGYSNYTTDPTLTTSLLPSTTYGCTVYAGQYGEGYAAWIDYNDDGVFDNVTERIGFSNGQVAGSGQVGVLGSSATFPITLACTPPAGVHRLRVRAMYFTNGSAVTPCTNNSYGETEDYLITIVAAPVCPSPGSLNAGSPTASSLQLNWILGCSAATNYDIEYGPVGFVQGTGTTVSNVAATVTASSGFYTLNGLAPNTAYDVYYRANCGSGNVSAWSLYARDTTLCLNTSSAVSQTSCGSYSWFGTPYTSSGVYTYSTNNQYGCDSIITLTLTINPIPTIVGGQTQTICQGDTAQLGVTDGVGGQITWLANGAIVGSGNSIQVSPTVTTTYEVFSGLNNCVSDTSSFTVTVNNPTTSSETISSCAPLYVWNNQTYTQSGVYTYSGQGSNGCDSTVTLNLTLNTPTTASVVDTACNSYTWNGQTYTQSGTYTYLTTNAAGCDSLVTLNLAINNATSSTSQASACGSYTWNGQTYTQSGTYTYVTPNAVGCDSLVTLNLAINNATSSTSQASACGSYTWNGQTYTQSGSYTFTSSNANGCDSVATLNLTINSVPNAVATGSGATLTSSTGSSYQWIDCATNTAIQGATNQTYTAIDNGTYAVVITNTSGCSDTSNCVVVDQIGLVEISKIDVKVNPNPSSGIFNIDFNSPINCKLNVLDASGRVVYSSEISNDTTIDLSFAMTGIYYLEVSNNEFKKIIRVVKN